MANPVLFSDEILTHFQCPECSGWWTIGDYRERATEKHIDRMYCPWCGTILKLNTEAEHESH